MRQERLTLNLKLFRTWYWYKSDHEYGYEIKRRAAKTKTKKEAEVHKQLNSRWPNTKVQNTRPKTSATQKRGKKQGEIDNFAIIFLPLAGTIMYNLVWRKPGWNQERRVRHKKRKKNGTTPNHTTPLKKSKLQQTRGPRLLYESTTKKRSFFTVLLLWTPRRGARLLQESTKKRRFFTVLLLGFTLNPLIYWVSGHGAVVSEFYLFGYIPLV